MRLIGWLLVALLSLCWLASEVSFQRTETFEMQWRRTVDGWELKRSWERDPPDATPVLVHPAAVGALQMLLAVGALFAFSNGRTRSGDLAATEPNHTRHNTVRGSYRFLRMRRARPVLPSAKPPAV